MFSLLGIFISLFFLFGGGTPQTSESQTLSEPPGLSPGFPDIEQALEQGYALATLAGGCFWCMEPPYDKTPGVLQTTSGFSGGHVVNPTYEQVVRGGTGHLEVVQIVYDPQILSFQEVLNIFWVNIDPLDGAGQFCDRGPHYRSAIFYHNEYQREIAYKSLMDLENSGLLNGRIQTEILRYEAFFPAEEYHQGYYLKNPIRYDFYRTRCGRDDRLFELWGGMPRLQL